MKISEVVFNKSGCCGNHPYADIRHPNGYVSNVQDNGDGTVTVTTFGSNWVAVGPATYDNDAEFDSRMQSDATLI